MGKDDGPDPDDYRGRERWVDQLVRRARINAGISQPELAALMREKGFRWLQSTVSRVEAGQRPLLLRETVALADILGIDHGLFWHRDEDEPDG